MRHFMAAIVAIVWVLGANTSWAAGASVWSTYLHDPARDNAVQDGNTFSGSAVSLHEAWSFSTKGGIAASPVLANGFAYVPSWDGNIYAVDLTTHAVAWKKFLGTATTWEGNTGVSNPPAFASDVGPNGAVVVGGGGREVASDSHLYLYALDAKTGALLWRTAVGNADAIALFDSPLYANGHIYIGTAGSGQKGFRPAYLFELDPTTGTVLHKLSVSGKLGGGAIWGSISFNAASNQIFVPTGDGASAAAQPLTEGLVAVDASTLKVTSHWHIPPAKQLNDDDFGTSATVFPGGPNLTLVGGATKFDGRYYAFDVRNLAKGPAWTQRISATGKLSPFDISSAAFASGAQYPGGATLFVVGSDVKIGTKSMPGALYALNPVNGHVIWRVVTGGAVLGAVAVYDNTVIVPIGGLDNSPGGGIEVRSATDGHLLASFTMTAPVFAAPIVVDGTIYVGSMDGVFHALTISP